MKKSLAEIHTFVEFLLDFQNIQRIVSLPNRDYDENDTEHSYNLAMLAWYIGKDEPSLDIDMVIKYALVHDLVEVYAGDTFAFSKDQQLMASKVEREKQALEQIKKQYPDFTELTQLIEDYEELSNEESKFVYALDKMIPVFMINLSGGRTWHEHKIGREELFTNKRMKIAGKSAVVEELLNEMESYVDTQPGLFPDM